MKSDNMSGKIKNYIIWSAIALLFIFVAVVIIFSLKRPAVSIEPNERIVISEVVTRNRSGLQDEQNEYHDWIEIRNASANDISMSGWYLSDKTDDPFKWEFPPITLRPGEYVIIFASGKDTFNTIDGIYHTNFKINGTSDSVVLTNINDQFCQTLELANAPADISYGRILTEEGTAEYRWFSEPTPGAENKGISAENAYDLPSAISGIVINEYMNSNSRTLYDSDGDYSDWVELYNTTDKDIDLTSCSLSDNEANLDKWLFPEDTVVPANGYLIIYLSGKDRSENGEIHADFGLSSYDSRLFLCDSSSRSIDNIELTKLDENISAGLSDKYEWVYFTVPTPGKENHSVYFSNPDELKPLLGSLMISEVCGAVTEPDTGLPCSDWIELFNASPSEINLNGFTLSNDPANLSLFTFQNISLAPGAFLTVEAVGADAVSGQLPFNIDNNGEDLFLCDASGKIIDSFSSGKTRIGISSGRSGDGSSKRLFFDTPTKGAANVAGFTSYAKKPEILTAGGNVKKGTLAEISVPENCIVRYTTNGSMPDENSPEYTEPLEITQNTVLKAVSFSENKIPSDCVFTTFLTEEKHDLPVICVSSDPDGLFSKEWGIFEDTKKDNYRPYFTSNFWMDWERAVDVEYYSENELQTTFTAGAKISGYYSRMLKKKSFALHVRSLYGASSVVYPFFGPDSPGTAKSLVLRGGAQDQVKAMIRDEFCAEIVRRNSKSVLTADWQPVALYLNGEYWGLYFLKEKINEDYLAINKGYDKNDIDIIYNRSRAIAGTKEGYDALVEYMKTNDMNSPKVWEYVCSQVDIECAMDYAIFEAFFDNYDSKNIRCYKTSEGKWRWIFFDLDAALDSSSKSNIGHAYITRTDPLIRQLFKNDSFNQMYLERYAELLNSAFLPETLTETINLIADQIETEIPRDAERWGNLTVKTWNSHVDLLEHIASNRRDTVIGWLKKEFKLSASECESLFE